ncbi:MAG: rhomboid family intramembrane serine protease [Phycisphaerae bacterium]
MPTLRCPCGAKLRVAEEHAGRKVKCPRCQARLRAPASFAKPQAPPPRPRVEVLDWPDPAAAIRETESAPRESTASASGSSTAPHAAARSIAPALAGDSSHELLPDPAGESLSESQLLDFADGERVEVEPRLSADSHTAPPASGGHCPKCQAWLRGRTDLCLTCGWTPGSEAPSATAGAGYTCRLCNRHYASTVRVCVDCGIELRSGKKLITSDDANIDKAYDSAERILRSVSWLLWIGVVPIASEAFGTRKPHATRIITIVTILASCAFWAVTWSEPSENGGAYKNLLLWWGRHVTPEDVTSEAGRILRDTVGTDIHNLPPQMRRHLMREIERQLSDPGEFHGYQLFTHAFLHAGLLHLAGNMLFLLIFGSRVNAVIGNLWTPLLYPLLGLMAGLAQLWSLPSGGFPHPMLGASGAIMGLAGMYLVLFPAHKVHMAAWLRWGLVAGFRLSLRLFPVRGLWVVLFYIAFDIFYTVFRLKDGVAHWAHLGGFLTGMTVGVVLLITRRVNAQGTDLLSLLFGKYVRGIIRGASEK